MSAQSSATHQVWTEYKELGKEETDGKLTSTFQSAVRGYAWSAQKERHDDSLESRLQLAASYVESQCTAKHGFLTQVSTDEALQNSVTAIPNIFDSIIILDTMLNSGFSISPAVIYSIRDLILRNRTSEGTWNYFPRGHNIIPDDLDTSSNAVSTLLALGIPNNQIVQMATNILQNVQFHNDGLPDVFFPVRVPATADGDLLEKWPVVRRVDLVTTANFLYLQNRVGAESFPNLSLCYDLLDEALVEMQKDMYDGAFMRTYAKSYTNPDVVCFFISRLLSVSSHASGLFQNKVAAVTEMRLLYDSTNPVAIACRIMSGVNSGLTQDHRAARLLMKESQNLHALQDRANFGFPKAGMYNAHKRFYFGSSALSTALAVAAISSLHKKLRPLKPVLTTVSKQWLS